MLVPLKSYEIEFLKIKLTHPDNVIGSWITPACLHHNRIRTGLSNLSMIDTPSELDQHKCVEESQYENKNPVSTRRSVHLICTESQA